MKGQGFLSDEKLFTICQWMMVTKQLFFETKKVTFSSSIKFQFSIKPLEIKEFKHSISFGIKVAHRLNREKGSKGDCRQNQTTSNRGTESHGSQKVGIAGLPKQKEFCGARGLYCSGPFSLGLLLPPMEVLR